MVGCIIMIKAAGKGVGYCLQVKQCAVSEGEGAGARYGRSEGAWMTESVSNVVEDKINNVSGSTVL